MEISAAARRSCALLYFFLATVAACAPPPFLTSPHLGARAAQFKTVAIIPPRVDVYEIGAGGVVEKIDDWSQNSTQNVLKAIESELKGRQGLLLRTYDAAKLSAELVAEMEQSELLFDAINQSIALHIYGEPPNRFEDKIAQFDYSFGAAMAKLNIENADLFLFARGVDHISSPGRQAVQLTTVLLAAAVGVMIIPQGGVTLMHFALVDARTGEILWYRRSRSDGATDLRNAGSAAGFVKGALQEFPLPGQP